MGGTYHLRAVLVHAPGDEVWLPADDHGTLDAARHALAYRLGMFARKRPFGARAVVWVITYGDDPRPVVVGLADDRTDWLADHGLDVEAFEVADGVTWAWVAA